MKKKKQKKKKTFYLLVLAIAPDGSLKSIKQSGQSGDDFLELIIKIKEIYELEVLKMFIFETQKEDLENQIKYIEMGFSELVVDLDLLEES